MAAHVRKDDTVLVLAGNENGKTGKLLEIITRNGRARVEVTGKDVKKVKHHLKRGRSAKAPQVGIIEEARTYALSNLMLVCPKCNKPTRTGRRELAPDASGKARRVRFCKSCDELVD
jgi:large subunit ribosomal protein L24